jgi:prepilin-type N-terminal cleavage/methylation domain-containing protein
MSASFANHRPVRGFTLWEMVVTLTVFLLLAGAVFGIVAGVLQSGSALQDNQNRRDELMALQAFLKKNLGEIPGQSVLVSYRRGTGDGLVQNGIIFGPVNYLTAIDAKVQPNGLHTLRLATFSSGAETVNAYTVFRNAVTSDDDSLHWVVLLHDVQHLDWKFQELNSPQWETEWDNALTKPNLVEFSLQIAGEGGGAVMDFWVPPLTPVPIEQFTTPATNNAPAPHVP